MMIFRKYLNESDFKKATRTNEKKWDREIRISKEKIEEMMKELDERKAIEPDRVSEYILKECRQEMAESIHDIIECSIKTWKVPKEWKRADIMPIYKKWKQRRTT